MYEMITNFFKRDLEKHATCKRCGNIHMYKDRKDNHYVCDNCHLHMPITIEDRIELIFDKDTFEEYNQDMTPSDKLKFKDSKKYSSRIKKSIKDTGYNSALISGSGLINGTKIHCSILNFNFMGGSLGSVEGEKITLCIEKAIEEKTGVLIISASGGARMQESSLSLMQMAKTSAALSQLSRNNLPYISLLTNPTMGGVSASFAFLGDIIIAEPEATIGFAGRRVIEQTIRTKLPDDFQTSEYLFKKGLIDGIIHRKNLKEYLYTAFDMFNDSKVKVELIENIIEEKEEEKIDE